MTRPCILGVLAATAVVLGGCLGGDDSDKAGGEQHPDAVVLTLANHDPDTNDLDEFAREVARQSDGTLRIEFKNGWRQGSTDYEPQTIEDVRDGKIDLAKVGARAFDLAGVRSLQPLVAPLAVDSYALERRVLGSPLAARMLQGVDRIDLVGIALLPGDLRKPLGISRALVGAADYRGATIGTRPSAYGRSDLPGARRSPRVLRKRRRHLGVRRHRGRVDRCRGGPPRRSGADPRPQREPLAARSGHSHESGRLRRAERRPARGAARCRPCRARPGDRASQAVRQGGFGGPLQPRGGRPALGDPVPARRASSGDDRALGRPGARPETRDAVREIAAMRADVEAEPAPTCTSGAGRAGQGWRHPGRRALAHDSTENEYAEIASPGGCRARELGRIQVRLRLGPVRVHDRERQGLPLGLRQLRGQRGPGRVDGRGWRRTSA